VTAPIVVQLGRDCAPPTTIPALHRSHHYVDVADASHVTAALQVAAGSTLVVIVLGASPATRVQKT